MNRFFAAVMVTAVVLLLVFSTVKLFQGDLMAAVSVFPVILVFYLFVLSRKG